MIRLPLDVGALTAGLPAPWRAITVIERLDSTNETVLHDADRYGANTVLVTEHQAAGRGRLDRHWVSPARSALTFSVAVRPEVARTAWGWLPLLAGLAVRDALSCATQLDVGVKWPNDVLVGSGRGKVAGILVQVDGDRAVIGVGVNVSTTAAELPVPTATSLELAGAQTIDRTGLLLDVLRAMGARYLDWCCADGDAAACDLAADYRRSCVTIRQVASVTGIGGQTYCGTAEAIDTDGRLVLEVDGHSLPIAAGEVQHVRPATVETTAEPASSEIAWTPPFQAGRGGAGRRS